MNELYTQRLCITFCVLIWKVIIMYSKPSLVVVVKPCSQWVAYGPPKKKQNKTKWPQVIETKGWHVAYGP